MADMGIDCAGWDPAYCPSAPRVEADVVNLGYVVNVIESGRERTDTLRSAWTLARRLLLVSARLVHERRLCSGDEFEDGVLTTRGTFQKFFEQSDLRSWIEQSLGVECVPAAPGVFLVFREDTEREGYVASQFRRRVALPRLRRTESLFREHEDLLHPLVSFMGERGRPPRDGELVNALALEETLGSVGRAVEVVRRVFGPDSWAEVARMRREDLLVYLALSRFGGRVKAGQLPTTIRNDVKFHYGTYLKACEYADRLLYSVGDRRMLSSVMDETSLGKRTASAYYVHRSYLESVPPELRVYEGCARALVGDVPDANLVKLSRERFQVSYLSYPDFDRLPHPPLNSSVVVRLGDLSVKYYDFAGATNPPVLHRKETFLSQDDGRYAKFRRLTEQEERLGLLQESAEIGTAAGWTRRLREMGVTLAGHRVVRARGGDVRSS